MYSYGMKRDQQGFGLVEILVVLGAFAVLLGVGLYVYGHRTAPKKAAARIDQQSTPATKEQVATAASNFIVAKVGEGNYEKYYTFDKSRSSYANPKDSKYDFIAYHFSPAKAITDYDDVIMVQVNRNNLHEIYADTVPDCVKNASLCSFIINGDKARTIAEHYFDTDSVTVSWSPSAKNKDLKGLGIVIRASSCLKNKTLLIDYRNGAILKTEAGCDKID